MILQAIVTLCALTAPLVHGQGTSAAASSPAVVPDAAASSPSSAAAVAPAPASTGPMADILNIVEARAATFVNATTLVLAGVSRSVQWVVDSNTMRRTGKIPTEKWLGQDFQKGGAWLANPAAVLHASVKGGNDTAFVLKLSAPVFNSSANSLYLAYTPVTAASQLVLGAGAANTAFNSTSTSAPVVGALLQDVALFVDDALPAATPDAGPLGGTKLGFEPLGGGRGGRGGISNAAGTQGDGSRGPGLVNVGLGGCYYQGGFNNNCYGYGYYGGAFG